MVDKIEVRFFMDLSDIIRKRGWPSPYILEGTKVLTGEELLEILDIKEEVVEVIFINGKVFRPNDAIINPGDRVALAPPGTPGPYRVLLGFRKM